jgi:hypothetical protein
LINAQKTTHDNKVAAFLLAPVIPDLVCSVKLQLSGSYDASLLYPHAHPNPYFHTNFNSHDYANTNFYTNRNSYTYTQPYPYAKIIAYAFTDPH